jgi:Tfp pilus assembly protein PilX
MRRENITKNGMQKRSVLANEEGSVMVLALAMLMLLTLIGTSAITTAMIEIQIAGSKKTHTECLFLAEGAAMQCAQKMENDPDLLEATYVNAENTVTDADIRNLFEGKTKENSTIAPSGTGYAAVYEGTVGSLKMGQPNLHAYAVYGWHDTPAGRVIVELGYRRAF